MVRLVGRAARLPGRDAAGILQAADGRIQGRSCCSAPTRSPTSPTATSLAGLDGAGTVIAIDTFLTESSRQADVVLPAAGYAEKPGTTTNLEGRVSRLNQKVTPPARPAPTG